MSAATVATDSSRRRRVRVAAVQFAVGVDVQANLETCLHWLTEAGKCQPDLVVLPEFVNHASWYDDKPHCHAVSVDLDGDFIRAIADKAREIGAYVVFNATVRRDADTCTGTSLLISPQGECLGTNDKQVLIGHENDFLRRAQAPGPVLETPIGRLAMYSCMDGVVSETPRCLALRGAQILCNSLNSFASDEGSLHIPVRAAENRVFVVAANKVGALIPEALLEPVSQATGIPQRFLFGAGDSQIVAPDGTVLAMASPDQPEVIWADIDPDAVAEAWRPDGTDLMAARRPALYGPVADDPASQPLPSFAGAASLTVAAVQLPGIGPGAVEAACARVAEAVASGAAYVVLPALFHLSGPASAADAAASAELVDALASVCGDAYVCVTLVEAAQTPQLVTVLIGAQGVVLRQPLLHASQRYVWSSLGEGLNTLPLPGAHVAILGGEDALYPELGRLLAMRGVDLLLVPCAPLEAWELKTGLVERAAENRINLVAATQPGPSGTSLICSLQRDFTVMTPWAERPFDGLLSQPELTRAPAHAGITLAAVYPACAENKVVSRGTDLVRGRAWSLSQPIVASA